MILMVFTCFKSEFLYTLLALRYDLDTMPQAPSRFVILCIRAGTSGTPSPARMLIVVVVVVVVVVVAVVVLVGPRL